MCASRILATLRIRPGLQRCRPCSYAQKNSVTVRFRTAATLVRSSSMQHYIHQFAKGYRKLPGLGGPHQASAIHTHTLQTATVHHPEYNESHQYKSPAKRAPGQQPMHQPRAATEPQAKQLRHTPAAPQTRGSMQGGFCARCSMAPCVSASGMPRDSSDQIFKNGYIYCSQPQGEQLACTAAVRAPRDVSWQPSRPRRRRCRQARPSLSTGAGGLASIHTYSGPGALIRSIMLLGGP